MDPITLDICWSRLVGVVNEEAAALMRTSFTSIVREAEKKALRDGSGGDGQWRGGLGQVIAFLVLTREPYVCSVLCDRTQIPPFGFFGGEPGATGQVLINGQPPAKPKAEQTLAPGDVVEVLAALEVAVMGRRPTAIRSFAHATFSTATPPADEASARSSSRCRRSPTRRSVRPSSPSPSPPTHDALERSQVGGRAGDARGPAARLAGYASVTRKISSTVVVPSSTLSRLVLAEGAHPLSLGRPRGSPL